MEGSPHSLLVAAGAEAFADRLGFPRCAEAELLVTLSPEGPAGPAGDTVGAVARDARGRLAVATSTGGTRGKLPGRVGDSPLAGAGGYADSLTAAVGSTGVGEALMKLLPCKRVSDRVALGIPLPRACREAIAEIDARFGAPAGLVGVDAAGRLAWAHNTDAMPLAWAVAGEPVRGDPATAEGAIDLQP
jgi:beta-aspartyl-peptidase (threonine type)